MLFQRNSDRVFAAETRNHILMPCGCSSLTILIKWVLNTIEHPELHNLIRNLVAHDKTILDKQTDMGYTALIYATRYSKTFSTEETVRLLIEQH